MNYPSRDDYRARDGGPPAATDYVGEFRRTGVCPRLVSPHDTAHQPCGICGHSDYLHGGFLNGDDPELTGCLVCWLKLVVRRDHHGHHGYRDAPPYRLQEGP